MSGDASPGRRPDWAQAKWRTPTLFEMDRGGAEAGVIPTFDVDYEGLAPEGMARESVGLPTLPRVDVVRHFTRLSQKNVGIDTSFYPLGSCSMKYNPKTNEEVAADPHATDLHPRVGDAFSQGALRVLYELQGTLAEVAGMDAVTLQPAAGAHGEFVGMLIARAYHADQGEAQRTEVIVPDSAHGTNPSSAALAGYDVVEVPSDSEGMVDLEALEAALGERTAAFMLTNPNTLGVFEENVEKIASMVHDAGALLYYDGANLNAIMGVTKPGAMGFDIVHFNLHKTFTTPHGGGGPGAGPVGVKARLAPYLPAPMAARRDDGAYYLDHDMPKSIGKVRGFMGNFGILLRAYSYARLMGGDGLAAASRRAVLNANYLRHRVMETGLFDLPYKPLRKHEFVLSAQRLKRERGVRAMDVAKRLLDYGYHAPTVYFPLIVDEAIMIEPTETESVETLDRFVDALAAIAAEDPEVVRGAPHNTSVARVDEVRAAKEPVLKVGDEGGIPIEGNVRPEKQQGGL